MQTKRCPEIKSTLSNDTKIAFNFVWNNSRCTFDSKMASFKSSDAIWTLIIIRTRDTEMKMIKPRYFSAQRRFLFYDNGNLTVTLCNLAKKIPSHLKNFMITSRQRHTTGKDICLAELNIRSGNIRRLGVFLQPGKLKNLSSKSTAIRTN